MKIATYNIWNSESGMPYRIKYIVNEIKLINADVICLQEVSSRKLAEGIAANADYPYWYFDNYPDNEEGLCIMAKMPFLECETWIGEANAIYCSFFYNYQKIAVVNVHLPWDSVLIREHQIIKIVNAVDKKTYDYVYMAGDFNCSDFSDVQRFLLGECTLNNCEALPCWFDLASAYAEITGKKAENTLDFRKNPRFKGNTVETNSRFDRILLQNTYPQQFPVLSGCNVFGTAIYEDIALAASDHYGVGVEME